LNSGQTLSKCERISAQKDIGYLFESSSSCAAHPLLVVYKERKEASGVPCSILVSVSKKRIKKAVNRNRIKRLIREAYRLHKNEWLDFLRSGNKEMLVAFIYIDTKLCPYDKLATSLTKVLNELKTKL
jgi:ribonuclease P protein component